MITQNENNPRDDEWEILGTIYCQASYAWLKKPMKISRCVKADTPDLAVVEIKKYNNDNN